MKLNKISILAMGTLLFAATSCDDKWEPNTANDGSIDLRSLSVDMSDAEKVTGTVISRATVDLSGYIVTISDKSGAQSPRTYTYGDMPEVLTLPVGDYSVNVESHKVQKAEWERPYYMGSKDFKVEKSKISSVGVVTAYFSSLKVTVKYDDNLKRVLGDDVKVTVTANDLGSLEYSAAETRAGYFEVLPGSNTMIAHFEGTINGAKVTSDTPFTDVEPGQHRIITYSMKTTPDVPGQSGNINPGGIQLDTEIINENISSNIAMSEDVINSSDRPGQEDDEEGPDNPNPPVVPDEPTDKAITFEAYDSPNLSLTDVNTAVPEGFGNAIVRIKADKGISHLVVTINTDNDTFRTVLSEMAFAEPFDLAYPTEAAEGNIESLKLPYGEQVINQKTVDFDITEFVSLLCIYTPANNSFVLSVTDNDNVTETMTLKFKAL